jgi:hypothetical protein
MNDHVEFTRRRLLALLGLGAAGAAVVPWGVLRASVPPDGPEVPVPTTEPALFQALPATNVADLAATLGWDVDAMFRFVADEVDYQPYDGALRGAKVTLGGKAGNSVDKALLLGALLTEAGVPWRFAVGELDAGAQDTVLSRPVRPLVEQKRRMAELLLPPDVAADWSGDGPWRRETEVDDVFRVAAERTEDTYAMLVDALTAAGVEPPPPVESLPPEEVARHVWVQVADGPDWVDLDPTLAGAVTGEPLTAAAETPAELPADLFHTVTLRLVAEMVVAGIPTPTEVVAKTMRAADLGGVPIYVVHAPATWLDVGGALEGNQRYRPAIIVGAEVVLASVFVALDKGEGALDALGTDGTAEGQTLAEWLEVEVAVPGAPTRRHHRLLFDRIPAADRQRGVFPLDDLPPVELIHIDDEIGDVFAPCAAPLIVGVSGHVIPWELVAPAAGGDATDMSEALARSAVAYAAVRDAVILDQAERLLAGATSTEATVVCSRSVLGDGYAEGRPIISHGFDVIHSGLEANRSGRSGSSPWGGVLIGSLHHAAERALLDQVGGALNEVLGEATELSVGRIFDIARETGHGIRVLNPGDPVDLAGITSVTRVLIEDALKRGHHVVVPERAVAILGSPRIGWWEYDPLTGSTQDTLDCGGHAVLAEWAGLILGIFVTACTAGQAGLHAWFASLRGFVGTSSLSGFPVGQAASFCAIGAPTTMGAIAA